MGERVGVDLATALFNRLAGRPPSVPAHPTGPLHGIVTVFPREWLFDPDSPYLRNFPVDAPWDDPALLEAMFAMRHES
jgi:molybdopterin-guanine dinucleotide biosynthesis protein A